MPKFGFEGRSVLQDYIIPTTDVIYLLLSIRMNKMKWQTTVGPTLD